MEGVPPAGENTDGRHDHTAEEWAETLTRTVAHLAAQLTLAQIRLRALATVLEERSVIDAASVAARVQVTGASDAGTYLRENLGEALVEVIDVDALERELLGYLNETGAG